jgi:hypothetical protein
MSTAKTATQNQKTKLPHQHTSSHHKSMTSFQPPTESMIEAAKVDYATRLFTYTQQQLQQVYSSPSEYNVRNNVKNRNRSNNNIKNHGETRRNGVVGDYVEVRDQKVKKASKKNNW